MYYGMPSLSLGRSQPDRFTSQHAAKIVGGCGLDDFMTARGVIAIPYVTLRYLKYLQRYPQVVPR